MAPTYSKSVSAMACRVAARDASVLLRISWPTYTSESTTAKALTIWETSLHWLSVNRFMVRPPYDAGLAFHISASIFQLPSGPLR